jgi:hypothetical protein
MYTNIGSLLTLNRWQRELLLDRKEDFVGLEEVEDKGGIITRKCGRSDNFQTCLFQGFTQPLLFLCSDCDNTKGEGSISKTVPNTTFNENLPGVEYVDEYRKLCFDSIHLIL